MAKEYGRLPTIPEYYSQHINNSVDLTVAPKQCCPFHKEDTPSLSYSAQKKRWRCFGACKVGGDIIDLHMKHYKLMSRAEAECSLKAMYGVVEEVQLRHRVIAHLVNEEKVDNESIYQKALLLANTPERWLEMDYCMSKTPVDYTELKNIVTEWETK